ncbi:unnamed protein product [Moneuplotes crassus]|uniref:EF-hand domain-containing protein n=1 Tax=Euplotes crassus TaxID=5936 RepID=A0AAD2CYP1_EUPCR|nr:unnamed protein product [Moneuplotes crassus]
MPNLLKNIFHKLKSGLEKEQRKLERKAQRSERTSCKKGKPRRDKKKQPEEKSENKQEGNESHEFGTLPEFLNYTQITPSKELLSPIESSEKHTESITRATKTRPENNKFNKLLSLRSSRHALFSRFDKFREEASSKTGSSKPMKYIYKNNTKLINPGARPSLNDVKSARIKTQQKLNQIFTRSDDTSKNALTDLRKGNRPSLGKDTSRGVSYDHIKPQVNSFRSIKRPKPSTEDLYTSPSVKLSSIPSKFYLLKAMERSSQRKHLADDPSDPMRGGIAKNLNHNREQFLRMYQSMKISREQYGIRKEAQHSQEEEKEVTHKIKNLYKKSMKIKQEQYKECLVKPARMPKVPEVLKFNIDQWKKKHENVKSGSNKKNIIKFAEKLFYSWDDDGSGILELEEIADQLISMKLAPDKVFVANLIRSLDPKFLNKADDDLSVNLKDFLKIFKDDRYMDNLKIEEEEEEKNKTDKVNKSPSKEENVVFKSEQKNASTTLPIQKKIDQIDGAKFPKRETVREVLKIPLGMTLPSQAKNLKQSSLVTKHKTQILKIPEKSVEDNNYLNESGKITFASEISHSERGRPITKERKKAASVKKTLGLVEKMEIVKNHWKTLNGGEVEYEIPTKKVAKLLVKLAVPDMETAYKVIRKAQHGSSTSMINYNEFKRIFCKPIFKKELEKMLVDILNFNPQSATSLFKPSRNFSKKEKVTYMPENLPISIRSSTYKRRLLMESLAKIKIPKKFKF